MGTYVGTDSSDVIVPGFTSPGVTENPPGTFPGVGADVLNGGASADYMDGGDGSDTYFVDNEGDITVERFNDALGGLDNVFASASHTIGFGIENLGLTGTGDIDGTGNANANLITGNVGNNVLEGLAGNDTLSGGDGDDVLRGGTGADGMAGGLGSDDYFVDDAGDTVTEDPTDPAGGTDDVFALVSFTLGDGVENLFLEGGGDLDGTGNGLDNTLIGNDGSNVLSGLGGSDLLDGGAGADALTGGTGDDDYYVDNAGDTVTEDPDDPAGGSDAVYASISYALGAGLEDLFLLGAGDLDGTGNSLDNAMTGSEGANRLRGKGGEDALFGLGGQDDLEGAGGNDRLEGGVKADTLLGGKGRDLLSGQGGSDDFVFTSVKDSGTSKSTRDQILDFKGKDDIVLTDIDADNGQAGDQDFRIDDGGSFDAGEIRITTIKAGVRIELNVDGDAKAEMSILLKGFTGTINASDFEF